MKSLDTNIFLYAINSDCDEHESCRNLINRALSEREHWVIADQIWFELYRLLRNPAVLEKPLSAEKSSAIIEWYRESSGWLQCAWEPVLMKELYPIWNKKSFTARNSFDLKLALTLKYHGVDEFYTRNTKDFAYLNFFEIYDPVGT